MQQTKKLLSVGPVILKVCRAAIFLAVMAGWLAPGTVRAQLATIEAITPTSQTVPTSFSASFQVFINSSSAFGYQWYFNSQPVPGATSHILTIINAQATNVGTYDVVVTNMSGAVTSAPVTLNITNTPLQITNVLFSTIASFTSNTTGAFPQAGVIQGQDGYLYGTTLEGGPGNSVNGTIFKVSTNSSFAWVFPFTDANGSTPAASLVQGSDGMLYGTTASGGQFGYGTVFKITPAGSFQSIHSFNLDDNNGANPEASLLLAPDGYLYSTTSEGGTNDIAFSGDGTVFKMSTNGALIWTVSLSSNLGLYPISGLVQGTDGNLYGTAPQGGTNDTGTIFRVTPSGSLSGVYSFSGQTDGSFPEAALTASPDGNLYGTTSRGGNVALNFGEGFGGVFKTTTNGALTSLAVFNGTNGASPQAPLFFGDDGNFYGTTAAGGIGYPASFGTIFQLATNGVLTTLSSFNGNYEGAFPHAALIGAKDGGLYGTTSQGGASDLSAGGDGSIFRVGVASPFILSAQRSGQTFSFTWNALVGKLYQVKYTTNLNQPDWVNLGAPISGTNGIGGDSDTIGGARAHRFYRVLLE